MLKTDVIVTEPISVPDQSSFQLPTIYFATNSAEVPSESKVFRQQAAIIMKQLPVGSVVRIAGFSDSSGNPADNVGLSQRRANAVRQVLIGAGVTPTALSAKGYGAYHSAAGENETMEAGTTSTLGNRLLNERRVEFRVIQRQRQRRHSS